MVAAKELAEQGGDMESLPGCHPLGVKPGDRFGYRAELSVIGVHKPFVQGIDFMCVVHFISCDEVLLWQNESRSHIDCVVWSVHWR